MVFERYHSVALVRESTHHFAFSNKQNERQKKQQPPPPTGQPRFSFQWEANYCKTKCLRLQNVLAGCCREHVQMMCDDC